MEAAEEAAPAEVVEAPPLKPSKNAALSKELKMSPSAASLQSLSMVFTGEDERPEMIAARSFTAACVRGALVGGGLKGGLFLLSLLAKRKRQKGPSVASELVEAFRFAAFVASFAGGFRALDWGISRQFGRASDPWRAALAGLLVGPSFLIAAPRQPWNQLATYLALRAALLGLRMGEASGSQIVSTKPMGLPHGNVAVMCLSASALLSAWILEPASLHPAYVKFLNIHGAKGQPVIYALREMATRACCTDALPGVRDWYRCAATAGGCIGAAAALPACGDALTDPCAVTHAGVGHLWHALEFCARGFPRSLPVYVPVYGISVLLVQRTNILRHPGRVAFRSAVGVARSSAFLSAYCGSAWLAVCALHHLGGKRPITARSIAICTLAPGLASLIEKPSRRTELALYCLGHALLSVAHRAGRRGMAPRLRRADALLVSLSSAIIMHAYARQPTTFGTKYKSVFDWVFGFSWRKKGSFSSLVY